MPHPGADPRPAPQLTLVTPPVADTAAFRDTLAAALAGPAIAAVVLRLEESDARTLIKRIKALAPMVQDAGAALLIDGHAELVARAGADGAHLTGLAAFELAAPALKPDRIAGCGAVTTRHDAMVAAETGADYVMFGGPGDRATLDARLERIGWWAEVFQVPCVGYAGAPDEVAAIARQGADFIALGEWVFADARGPAAAIAEAVAQLSAAEPVA